MLVALLGLIVPPSTSQASPYTSFWKVAAQPSGPDLGLTNKINVGTRFRINEPGQVVGLRYYDLGGSTGKETGQLYTANGDRVAETTFPERTTGWQESTFKTPVTVSAGTEVVASVYLPRGQWAYSLRALAGKELGGGPITALNGQYLYWGGEHFPSMVTTDALFVDLMFVPETPATTPSATPSSTPTSAPTTAKPTTSAPTTAKPTTAAPTTAKPTTAAPTTAKPTTAKPTTAAPTTAKPTTAKPTTSAPTTSKPTTAPPVVAPSNPKTTAAGSGGASTPIGACALKPSASNTGASGSLASSSVTSVSKSGSRLENVNISGSLTVTGDNVVVRNVSVTGSILVRGSSGVVLDHVSARGIAISGAQNTTVQYANVWGGNDAIHVTSDTGPVRGVTLKYNYIHDPKPSAGAHYDGTQVRGVDGMTVSCSTYALGPWQSTYNAVIYLENAQGGDHNVTIANNWLDGGGYTVFVNADKLTVTGNRIGQMAHWGACRNTGASFVSKGNVWDATGAHVDMCGEG